MSSPPENPADELLPPFSVDEAIRLHHEALITHLRHRHGRQHDAADIAQETYLRLMRYEGARDVRSASALLFRVAINVVNDRLRADASRNLGDHIPIEDVELPDEHPSPERQVASQQDLARLYEIIERLQPPKLRQVFILSRIKHMTYPEIARHCNISVKMVEKYVSQALAICAIKVGDGLYHPSITL